MIYHPIIFGLLKADPRKYIIPDGQTPRALELASLMLAADFPAPILIGDPETVRSNAAAEGFPIDGAEIQTAVDENGEAVVLTDVIEDILNYLTPREGAAIRLRCGLDDGQMRTLEEVGKAFGVTKKRIGMIEAKVIRRMLHNVRRRNLRDFCK